MFLNPESELVKNFKTKELAVKEFLLATFPQFDWVCDKRILDGCSLRRPDFQVDFGSHVLFIEVDENQHEPYSCENKRIMQLSQDIGHRPSVFVRFNPDSYKEEDGSKVASCWKKNHQGFSVLVKKEEWYLRLQKLKECIETNIAAIPTKCVTLECFFYNKPQIV